MDIYAFVGLPDRFFRSIGLVSFFVTSPPPPVPLWMTAHFITSCFMLGVCVLGEAVHFFKVYRRPEYFLGAASVFLYFGFNVLSFAKMFTVLVKRPQLSHIVQELDAMFPRTPRAREQYRVYAYVRLARRLIRPYSVFQMLMIWSFNLVPTVEGLIGFVRDGEWRIDFPYENWYPIEAYRSGWFELCYLSQIWGSYCSASGALAMDILMCALAAQVCMHFDELSARLRAMKPHEAMGWRRGGAAERRDYGELCRSIRTHGRIIG